MNDERILARHTACVVGDELEGLPEVVQQPPEGL
jgi:hypothetical protein